MSQQQMQSFEQEPPRERQEHDEHVQNTDPREQQMPFEGPYYGEGAYYGQKLRPRPQPPKPKRPFWLLWLLVPILLVFLVAAPMGFVITHRDRPGPQFFSAKPIPNFPGQASQSFTIFGNPTVVINDPTGSVTVHTGSDHVVTVSPSNLIGPPDRGDGSVQATQDGDQINVTVPDSPGDFGGSSLDVTVPATANIEIHSRTGSITIEGVNGQMTADTENGSISVADSELSGSSLLQSQRGSINFQGTLDPRGNYQFLSNNGSVNVALPADGSYHFEASSRLGSVNNAFGSNNVGNGGPTVEMKSDTGSINVSKG